MISAGVTSSPQITRSSTQSAPLSAGLFAHPGRPITGRPCNSPRNSRLPGSTGIPNRSSRPPAAISHFGHGVLTFHVPIVFRTPPGVDLYVTGPINSPKDGIAPLTGIVETDWLPFSFTMNWLFTRSAQRVRFAAGEPFCHVFPVARGAIEAVEPEIAALSSDPDLHARHDAWAESRAAFNRDLADPQSQASLERWQKLYQRGRDAAGVPAGAAGHRTRLRARPFARR